MTVYTEIDSPVGPVLIEGGPEGLSRVEMAAGEGATGPSPGATRDDAALAEAAAQLSAYFAGDRTAFELELAPTGTPFQLQVWEALRQIPFGATRTYRDIAEAIGRPTATRAVGAANGRNPLPIIVPCHRVIGSDGSLTGFRGGVPLKRALLDLEGAQLPLVPPRGHS